MKHYYMRISNYYFQINPNDLYQICMDFFIELGFRNVRGNKSRYHIVASNGLLIQRLDIYIILAKNKLCGITINSNDKRIFQSLNDGNDESYIKRLISLLKERIKNLK